MYTHHALLILLWINLNVVLMPSQDNKDILKLIIGKHNLTSPISSYSRPEVTTKSQSYFFTHSVKGMAVTLTAKGITSKQVLLGTVGDQVSRELQLYIYCGTLLGICIDSYLISNRFWHLINGIWILVVLSTQHKLRRKKESFLLQIPCLSFLRYEFLVYLRLLFYCYYYYYSLVYPSFKLLIYSLRCAKQQL